MLTAERSDWAAEAPFPVWVCQRAPDGQLLIVFGVFFHVQALQVWYCVTPGRMCTLT